MSLPKYEKYKESGVAWLDSIPAHWGVKCLKHVCNIMPSNVDKKSHDEEPSVSLCNYTDVYYRELITADIPFMVATASTDQIRRFTLRSGDVLITKDSETADDIGIAAYVPRDLPGVVCGYHLSVIRTRGDMNGLFVKRLFDSHYVRARLTIAANGLTRVGLSQYAIDNLDVPVPSSEEQTAIATFLDHETTKIDALIAEQQRLIELLREKRQAVISHAVTKGLNPAAPMKPSGIEWLGDIPAYWERVQLGKVCVGISDGPHFSPQYVDDGYLFLSARNIRVDGWSFDDAKYISEQDYREFCKRVVPQEGDVLYTKGGTTGVARVVDFATLFQVWVHVAVLKIDNTVANPYFVA